MRLKTFSAPSMTEALKCVKEHFGEEAIIVSSKKAGNGSGVCVTAAIDKDELSISSRGLHDVSEANDFDIITEALTRHGTPAKISSQIICVLIYLVTFYISYLLVPDTISNIWAKITLWHVIATLIIYIFSFILQNSSLYDPFWSVAPIPIIFYLISLTLPMVHVLILL